MQENGKNSSWLTSIWTKHRDNWITVAEMWGRRILLEWWPLVKRNRNQLLKYSGWVRKEYLTNGIIREYNMKLEPRIFGRTGKIKRKNSSSVFKWRWETPPKLLRYSGRMKKRKGWTKDEKNLKAILEMTSDWWNSYLHQTSKRIWD